MDRLNELTNSLNEEELKQFKKYLTHKSNVIKRKDLEIFQKVSYLGKYESRKIVTDIYGSYNSSSSSAHRMLRLRIKKSLEDFIHQQVRKDDTPLYIHKLITIARFLYNRKKYKLSWYYLEKAEKIAKKAEEYQLLDQVYQFMVEYAWTQNPNVLGKIIKKESANKDHAEASRSINLALSVIHNKLRKHHSKGKKPDIEKITKDALSKFGVQQIFHLRASQYYKLAMLVKVSLEEKKEYEELYKYMKQTLRDMENAGLFNKYNYQYRIELLNVLCYSAAGSGDYEASESYMNIIEEENKKYPETDLLSIRSFMAKVVCLSLTNRIKEAIEVLEYLKVKYKKLYQYDDQFFMTLNYNMATAHLHIGNISVSRKYVNEVLNHSKRIIRSFGLGDLFYCYATDCLLAIDAGDLNYAESRIKATERKFRDLILLPHNKRKEAFLKILRYIIHNNRPWNNENFKKEARSFIELQPLYKPGLEFISFNAWLYSKVEKVPYSEGEYNKYMKDKISIA